MIVTFPANCITPASRLEWCHRLEYKLRLIHNFMGKWHREGVGLGGYNQLPNKVKNKYAYHDGLLSLVAWKEFKNYLENYESALWVAMGEERTKANTSTYWNPDMDTDIS